MKFICGIGKKCSLEFDSLQKLMQHVATYHYRGHWETQKWLRSIWGFEDGRRSPAEGK